MKSGQSIDRLSASKVFSLSFTKVSFLSLYLNFIFLDCLQTVKMLSRCNTINKSYGDWVQGRKNASDERPRSTLTSNHGRHHLESKKCYLWPDEMDSCPQKNKIKIILIFKLYKVQLNVYV